MIPALISAGVLGFYHKQEWGVVVNERKSLHVELAAACSELFALSDRVNSLAQAYSESGHEVALTRVRHAARLVADTAGELWTAGQIEATWKDGK